MAAHGPSSGSDETLVHLLLDGLLACTPHHVTERLDIEKSPRQVRPGLGRAPRGDIRTAEGAGGGPADAVLTPRPDALPAWDALRGREAVRAADGGLRRVPGERRLEHRAAARHRRRDGRAGQTAFYIFGDNGASLEGTITGSFNELTMQNGIALTAEQQLSLIEQYRGSTPGAPTRLAPHYASAWAWAGNAPFQWGKQVASHLAARATAWSSRGRSGSGTPGIASPSSPTASTSGRRSSKPAGIPEPKTWTGPNRSRWRGTSFLYSFDDPAAAERHTVQYFETVGNPGDLTRMAGGPRASSTASRGTYRRGRWRDSRPEPTTHRITWELYYLPDDFSQANDLAAAHPEKLAELKESVLGRGRQTQRAGCWARSRSSSDLPPMPTNTTYTFYGDVQNVASGMIPRVYGHSTRSRPSSSAGAGRRGRDHR